MTWAAASGDLRAADMTQPIPESIVCLPLGRILTQGDRKMGTKMLETSTIDKDQQDPRREFIDRTPENPLLPSNLYTCTGTGYYFCVSNYLYNFILLKYLI